MSHALAARVISAVARVRSSDDGATAVEYGMMVALIAAACVAAVGFLGQGVVAQMFQTGIEMFDAAP